MTCSFCEGLLSRWNVPELRDTNRWTVLYPLSLSVSAAAWVSLVLERQYIREYRVVGIGDMSYIFMLCSWTLNKCSISYWQSIMNFNTIKQQIEMIIMKNRWLYSLQLVSIIYLVLIYFNFTAYIGDYLEEENYGFCIHCNGSVMCGTCKCAETVLHWIVQWWRLSLLHTLWVHIPLMLYNRMFHKCT